MCVRCGTGRIAWCTDPTRHGDKPDQHDSSGVDRQTYEQPNCGSTKRHDPHFHTPIGGLRLNCSGVAGKAAQIDGAAWRKLYDDLGLTIDMKNNGANDMSTPDHMSLTLAAQAESLQEVRQAMREIDSTLPVEEADES